MTFTSSASVARGGVRGGATGSSKEIFVPSSTSAFNVDQWQKGGIASFEQTCFSEYWKDIPPLVEQNMMVDPYNFLHRMALGKYLIEHTGGPDVWGPQCWKHWFWAYLAQMDWQWRSGRFQPAGINDHDRNAHPPTTIATDSWWAYMNMGFIVGAYCGAAEAGKVPAIELAPSLGNDDHFQAVVENWRDFFLGPHADYVARNIDLSKQPCAVFPLYDQLWCYHSSTMRHGRQGARSLEAILPPDDLKVGLGWCKMVELLDAMGWPHLSLESLMEDGAGYLPTRRIECGGGTGSSSLEYLKEHRNKEYLVCQNLMTLYEMPEDRLHLMANFWKRVSRYNSIRSNLPKTMNKVTFGSAMTKVITISKLLGLAVLPQTALGCASWLSLIVAVVAAKNFTRRGR